MRYRPEIDGLRAVAVVSVILFHAGIGALSGGFLGVDVFFVISGYLITSIVISERQRDDFSMLRFYERRARRILPALFLVMAACIPFAWFYLLPSDMLDFSRSVLATILFSSNILFYFESSYFNATDAAKPLLHTWSLGVEEQFYLIAPALILAGWKLGTRWLTVGVLLVAILSLWIAQRRVVVNPDFAFFLLQTRAWELGLGCLVALQAESLASIRNRHTLAQWLSLLGLCAVLASLVFYDSRVPTPSLYTLLPALGTAAVLAFASEATLAGRLLAMKPMVMIGLISYSAYLWHHPVFAYLKHASVVEPEPWTVLAIVPGIFIASYLSWRLVEQPFRNAATITRRRLLAWCVLLTLAFSGFGLLGILTDGFASREMTAHMPPGYLESTRKSWGSTLGEDGVPCVTLRGVPCRLSSSAGGERILMIGDSHSEDFSAQYRRHAASVGANAWQLSMPGCSFTPVSYSKGKGECGRARSAVDSLVRQVGFDTILIIGNYRKYQMMDEDADSLISLIRGMISSGARVVLFQPRFLLNAPPPKAALLQRIAEVRIKNDTSFEAIESRVLASLGADANLTYFRQADLLITLGCGRLDCFDGHSPDRLPLYRDRDHLTNLGADLVFSRVPLENVGSVTAPADGASDVRAP